MALSEIELMHCMKALAQFMERRRPPAHIRDQLDISYRVAGHSVELLEIRPDWQDRTKTMETPFAKATFVRTRNHWKVFWMRRTSNGTATNRISKSRASKHFSMSSIEMNTAAFLAENVAPNLSLNPDARRRACGPSVVAPVSLVR